MNLYLSSRLTFAGKLQRLMGWRARRLILALNLLVHIHLVRAIGSDVDLLNGQ
jgi:hypothetical protein